MTRRGAVAAVVGLFLLGILVGVLATHLFYARQLRQPGGLAEVGLRFVAADLDRRLDLTPQQQEAVDAILDDARGELARVRTRMGAEVLEVAAESRERIRAELTPEQRERFEELRRRHRQRLEDWLAVPPDAPAPDTPAADTPAPAAPAPDPAVPPSGTPATPGEGFEDTPGPDPVSMEGGGKP